MTLSGLRSLDKSAIVCFLFVVSGKREPQCRKLLVSLQLDQHVFQITPTHHSAPPEDEAVSTCRAPREMMVHAKKPRPAVIPAGLKVHTPIHPAARERRKKNRRTR